MEECGSQLVGSHLLRSPQTRISPSAPSTGSIKTYNLQEHPGKEAKARLPKLNVPGKSSKVRPYLKNKQASKQGRKGAGAAEHWLFLRKTGSVSVPTR